MGPWRALEVACAGGDSGACLPAHVALTFARGGPALEGQVVPVVDLYSWASLRKEGTAESQPFAEAGPGRNDVTWGFSLLPVPQPS